jgi:uncharacterized protein
MQAALLDTGFLLAVAAPGDLNHSLARAAMRELIGIRVVPAPVLPELFFMVSSRVNYPAAIRLFEAIQGTAFNIEGLTPADMIRMGEIMGQYRDSEFDFVDTALMALAERMNITRVYTVDKRDFATFRPRHCSHLTLLP